ncbi:hypothetical protein HHA02_11090 [Cobetia marina]|nr:hypothetical protein HHA02_11090 [Cobetia marina]
MNNGDVEYAALSNPLQRLATRYRRSAEQRFLRYIRHTYLTETYWGNTCCKYKLH